MDTKEIKWYEWLWLWAVKTKSVTSKDTKKGTTMIVTLWYKEHKGHTYIVKEKVTFLDAKGKANKRVRRHNGR